MTVNVEGRGATADEAAAWVEVLQRSGDVDIRRRCARAMVIPNPYAVKYWEIGNEIWGDWVRGHSDAATYARNLTRYCRRDAGGGPFHQGDRRRRQRHGVEPDRAAPCGVGASITWRVHHYYSQRDMGGDLRNLMARPLHYERWYGELDAVLREVAPDRRPKLAINEWGLDLPESQQYSILGALYGARLMNVFERRSDLVGMSAVSDLVNGWPGGIIQASRHGVFVTPIYLVNRLYATHLGAERLSATVEGPTVSSTREGRDVPVLDAVASRSADGRTIFHQGRQHRPRAAPAHADQPCADARVAASATLERVVADSLAAVKRIQDAERGQGHARVREGAKQFRARSAPALGVGAHAHSRALAAIAGLSQPFCYHRACLRRDGSQPGSSSRARASARWR